MEKEKLRKPYEDIAIEVLEIHQSDVITTSGETESTVSPGMGGAGYDPGSWT